MINDICKKHSYLSLKLSLTSLVILLVIISFYLYLSCEDLIATIDDQHKEKALSMAAMANTAIDSKATLNNRTNIQQICENLARIDADVLNVSFYMKAADNRAVRYASSNRAQLTQSKAVNNLIPKKGQLIIWNELRNGNQHVVEILAPIYVEGKSEAILGVLMNLEGKDKAVRAYIVRSLLYALAGFIVVALVLYLRFRKEVHRPVRQLIEGTQEVAKGNLETRVNLTRRDELGKLSEEFDNMAEVLQQREEESTRELQELKEKWIEAEEKSRTDFLTNLDNHRSFQAALEAELNRASRINVPVTLLFCDLDRFKNFNDINGHLLGDKALFEVAEIIKESLRNYDVAARYGGEEFAVILPNTDAEGAMIVAERIRHNVEHHHFTASDGYGKLTVSIGLASYPKDTKKREALIAAADFAMYESKKNGRNMITTFSSDDFIERTKVS